MYFSALATGRITVKHVNRKKVALKLLSRGCCWSACWPVNWLVRPALMTSLSCAHSKYYNVRAWCNQNDDDREYRDWGVGVKKSKQKPSNVWIITGRNHSQSLARSAPLIQRFIRRFSSLRHPRPWKIKTLFIVWSHDEIQLIKLKSIHWWYQRYQLPLCNMVLN